MMYKTGSESCTSLEEYKKIAIFESDIAIFFYTVSETDT